MLNFNDIKEMLMEAQEAEATKAAKAEKLVEEYLQLTSNLIETNMSFDPETKIVFADINREEVTSDFWEKFDYNGLLLKTRLPKILQENMGEGVKVKFNTLSYGKEEDEYIFFKFEVELVD